MATLKQMQRYLRRFVELEITGHGKDFPGGKTYGEVWQCRDDPSMFYLYQEEVPTDFRYNHAFSHNSVRNRTIRILSWEEKEDLYEILRRKRAESKRELFTCPVVVERD
jgi:hypothetical protein